MPRPSERQMMEMAVEQMCLSVPERGKMNPKVGAVALLRDGTVLKAYRADYQNGEHAEETLIEREAERRTRFDDAILFVTLEPCSPGSRGVREIPCAERVAKARFKTVYVGVHDPWKTINGGGVAYLHSKGVSVRPFDADLQVAIENENADWLVYVRNKNDQGKAGNDILVEVLEDSSVDDLDDRALKFYRAQTKMRAAARSPEMWRALCEDRVLDRPSVDAHLTGFGAIAMARNPRRFVDAAGMNVLARLHDGAEFPMRFDDPAVLLTSLVEDFLTRVFPSGDSRDTAVRQAQSRIPFRPIREATLNGIIHRRFETDAKTFLVVDERAGTVVVRSPGEPVNGVSLDDLNGLRADPFPRNPKMVNLFAKTHISEEQGLGMFTFRDLRSKGLPAPRYALRQGNLVLTLFLSRQAMDEAALATLDGDVLDRMNDAERRGWQFLFASGSLTAAEYADHLEITERQAQRHLGKFVRDLEIARREGEARASRYFPA